MSKSLWKRYALFAACCLALHLAGAARSADDEMPEGGAKKSDTKLYDALREIINHGADLYNSGDRNGCYRLFEGVLLGLKFQMSGRPDIVKLIDSGLADANRQPQVGNRAFVLRRTLVDIRGKLKGDTGSVAAETPEKTDTGAKVDTAPKPAGKSLWDRMGGEPAFTKVVNEFVDQAGDDPAINVTRGGKIKLDEEAVTKLKKSLVAWFSSVTGGPIKYKGKSMKELHKGMGITDKEFDAGGALLQKVLEDNKVKPADADALMKIVGSTRKDIVEAAKAPEPKKKPTPAPAGDTGNVFGDVKLDTKAVNKAEVIFVPNAKPDDLTKKATTDEEGGFQIDELPVGDYKVIVKGGGVPPEYSDVKKTPLKYTVKKGQNDATIDIAK
jgi:hemoglobin